MARSTQLTTSVALGRTKEERDRRSAVLRLIAANVGLKGRSGGNLSALLVELADLPEGDRRLLEVFLSVLLTRQNSVR